MIRHVINLYFLLIFSAGATTQYSYLLKDRENILIDTRKSRHGRGDIASGVFVAFEAIEVHKYQGKVTILVDDIGQNVIEKMFPYGLPRQLQVKHVREIQDETFDFYFYPGRQHGRLPKDLDEITNFTKDAPRFVQVVFGHTEKVNFKNPEGTLSIGKKTLELFEPGPLPHQSGIYYDPVIAEFEDFDKGRLFYEFANDEALYSNFEFYNELMQIIIANNSEGINMALSYGLTLTQSQFHEQLRSLLRYDEKFFIITPSTVDTKLISMQFSDEDIEVVKSFEKAIIPQTTKIRVLETNGLPHRLFNYLMLLSDFPPTLSGDGALSAGIKSSRPFVMTRVAWNLTNIRHIGRLVSRNVKSVRRELVHEIFGGELDQYSFNNYLDLLDSEIVNSFQKVSSSTDFILNQSLKRLEFYNKCLNEGCSHIDSPDKMLSLSIIFNDSAISESDKNYVMSLIHSGDSSIQRFFSRNSVPIIFQREMIKTMYPHYIKALDEMLHNNIISPELIQKELSLILSDKSKILEDIRNNIAFFLAESKNDTISTLGQGYLANQLLLEELPESPTALNYLIKIILEKPHLRYLLTEKILSRLRDFYKDISVSHIYFESIVGLSILDKEISDHFKTLIKALPITSTVYYVSNLIFTHKITDIVYLERLISLIANETQIINSIKDFRTTFLSYVLTSNDDKSVEYYENLLQMANNSKSKQDINFLVTALTLPTSHPNHGLYLRTAIEVLTQMYDIPEVVEMQLRFILETLPDDLKVEARNIIGDDNLTPCISSILRLSL